MIKNNRMAFPHLKRGILASYLVLGLMVIWNVGVTQDADSLDSNLQKFTIPGSGINFQMALVPGGSFFMGSPEEEMYRSEDEGPAFEVSVDSFWMGIHEVTFQEFLVYREKDLDKAPEGMEDWDADAVMRPSPPYEDPTFGMGQEDYPAVSMTQFSALQYCKWLSEKSGRFFRLPTEAEWEYACRAGSAEPYYFGDDPEDLDDHAWHRQNSSEKYHKVGSKESNPYGLFDMLGNVSEWTLDQYKADAYQMMASEMGDDVNPWIRPTRLHPRTVRGGSWDDDPDQHRCACRIKSSGKWKERDPQIPKSFWWNTDSPFVGFRIVSPYKQPSAEEQAEFWEMVLGG
jgi:formylglycine-generating enzyme required for sulfatase activity